MITMIITSPEIEKYMDLETLNKGQVNEISEYNIKLASSGVYSAYIVKLLQGEPFMLGFAGGLGGRYIKNYLDKNRIKSSLLYRDGEIKSKFIINDGVEKTILIDNNTNYDDLDSKNLKHKITTTLEKTSIYIINGSLKSESVQMIITNAIDFINEKNKIHLLYLTDGYIDEFLKKDTIALVADASQFKALEELDNVNDKLDVLKSYLKRFSIRGMIIRDKNLIYGISKNKIVKIQGNEGDLADMSAIVGALAIGLKRKYEFEKTMKLVGSVASSFKSSDFPDLVSRKMVDAAKANVKLVEIYSNGVYLANV